MKTTINNTAKDIKNESTLRKLLIKKKSDKAELHLTAEIPKYQRQSEDFSRAEVLLELLLCCNFDCDEHALFISDSF